MSLRYLKMPSSTAPRCGCGWKNRTNENYLTAKVFLLRRPWDEHEATHHQTAMSAPWQIAGAHGESDRQPKALSSAELPANGPVDWDVTGAVQTWVQDPASNYGLILSGHPRTCSLQPGRP